VNAEIVIEVPEELKSLVKPVKELLAAPSGSVRSAESGKALRIWGLQEPRRPGLPSSPPQRAG
jgi:hypothetical protein